jgi:hypothetical protein
MIFLNLDLELESWAWLKPHSGPPRARLSWVPRTGWDFSQNWGFELKIPTNEKKKTTNQNKTPMAKAMASFRDGFTDSSSLLSIPWTDVQAEPPSHWPWPHLTVKCAVRKWRLNLTVMVIIRPISTKWTTRLIL